MGYSYGKSFRGMDTCASMGWIGNVPFDGDLSWLKKIKPR